MPIFEANGGLHHFAHVPKCAGTTLTAHLRARVGDLGLTGAHPRSGRTLQHLTWADLTKLIPAAMFSSSFAVVRHPVARFVSAYNMRAAQPVPPFPRGTTPEAFLDWVEARLPSAPGLLDNHLRPQTDFLGPETAVFRLEDGLDRVTAHLDAAFGPAVLPPLARHDHRPAGTTDAFDLQTGLPDAMIARLSRLYAGDFAAFGYAPAPHEPPRVLVPRAAPPPLARLRWRLRVALGGLRHGAVRG